jgi:hypothetical protein
MAEPIAVTDILSELNTQWNASNVTKPQLVELNGPEGIFRIDLNRADYIIGQPGSPTMEETPIGNWKFVDRTYSVTLSVQTRDSRQRLYNLMREIRKICHVRRHEMTNFQRLQFLNFNEDTTEQANVWTGTVSVQLVNQNVLAEIT